MKYTVCLLAMTLIAPITSAKEAFSMGSTRERVADRVNVGQEGVVSNCPGGKIFERFYESGNAYGGGENLFLACLMPSKDAPWVLISGMRCHVPKASGACNKQSPTIKPLQTSASTRPPFVDQYTLRRYALGRDCHVLAQKLNNTDGSSTEERRWICHHIDLFDGTLGSKVKTISVETNSTRALSEELEHPDPEWAADEFAISRHKYEIDLSDDVP
jgi:hypothetical protein